MVLPDYLADVANEMRAKSTAIRRDFATHRLSAGENREELVKDFLAAHLPRRFEVSSGMVISHNGAFSNQADLVVVDALNNVPLYGNSVNKLWPVESVLALLEVKTSLGPSELRDCIAKGRRFKTLQRRFFNPGYGQRIADSLFVIWAFDCPTPETLKQNLLQELAEVPRSEHPDFVIVPDRVVVRGGSYLELSTIGQPTSSFRRQLEQRYGPDLEKNLLPMPLQVGDAGGNSLMAWYLWFYSWLMQAGDRSSTLTDYLPPEQTFGRII
ncbi:DUF6602 domain-containing protein [Paraburkholderia fungorum]|uniref:DUF6602 domain-containing protein n=1 Tax=Paraburkholderia fungorum TaxID=134537 RepID=UPI00402BC252